MLWWHYLLIGLGALIVIVAVVLSIVLHHNKYFFWRWPLFVDDRNGVRKPGSVPKDFFGDHPAPKNRNLVKTLQTIESQSEEPLNTEFKVIIDKDTKSFEIEFDDVKLTNGGLRLWSHGQKYTSFSEEVDPEKELRAFPLKIQAVNEDDGENYLGKYHDYLISWYSVDRDVLILTTIRIYQEPSCIMFRIDFPTGLEETKRENYENQCIQFPVFQNQSNRSLIFTYDQVNFSEPRDRFVNTSAPILFYNEDLDTFILSPTMNFLVAWNTPNEEKREIRLGIEGDIEYIPEKFIHESILVVNKGIANTFKNWGDIMLRYYQKERLPNDADHILSYLGYWTDAGTFYYYNHGNFSNYEECLLQVKKKADEEKIPYGYFQLDSWFYPKDDGTLEWKGKEEYFNHGTH